MPDNDGHDEMDRYKIDKSCCIKNDMLMRKRIIPKMQLISPRPSLQGKTIQRGKKCKKNAKTEFENRSQESRNSNFSGAFLGLGYYTSMHKMAQNQKYRSEIENSVPILSMDNDICKPHNVRIKFYRSIIFMAFSNE